jgi:hypothetical protein
MLPKMPDMAWLRDGGCIAAVQTTDNGAAMTKMSPQNKELQGRKTLERRGDASSVWRTSRVYTVLSIGDLSAKAEQ